MIMPGLIGSMYKIKKIYINLRTQAGIILRMSICTYVKQKQLGCKNARLIRKQHSKYVGSYM